MCSNLAVPHGIDQLQQEFLRFQLFQRQHQQFQLELEQQKAEQLRRERDQQQGRLDRAAQLHPPQQDAEPVDAPRPMQLNQAIGPQGGATPVASPPQVADPLEVQQHGKCAIITGARARLQYPPGLFPACLSPHFSLHSFHPSQSICSELDEMREMRREREEKSGEEEAMEGDGDPGESRAGGGSATIAHAASGALADGETTIGGSGEAQAGGMRQAVQAGGETHVGVPGEAQAGGERQEARAGGEIDMGEPGDAQAGGEQQSAQAGGETGGGEPDGGKGYGSVLNNTAATDGGIGGRAGGYQSPVVWCDISGGLLWSDNSRNRQTHILA